MINKNNAIIEWLLGISLFIMTNPCFFWSAQAIVLMSVILFYIIALTNNSIVQQRYVLAFVLFTLFYLLVGIRYGIKPALFYTIAIPLVFLIKPSLLVRGFNRFIEVLSLMLACSLIVYVLVAFLGFSLPHVTIDPINEFKVKEGFVYDMYPFLIFDPRDLGAIFQRFHGIYDEPGVVGTMCAVILSANGYKLRKWYFIVLFIAGLFSFSLFFYIVTVCYYIINVRLRNMGYVLVIFALIVYGLSFIPGIDILITNRFIIEDGVWQGNSRGTADYEKWYSNFRHTPEYLWGLGPGANLKYNPGGSSYKDMIVNYGLPMFIIYILSYVVLILRTKTSVRNLIITSLVVFGYIFQRPFITDVFMQVILLYFIYKNAENRYELSNSNKNS